ncbi:AraC family transcriptional regulator [Paenibacillus dakarensis]|uniref:AraC family transcriptional regulator n=1 Tax=Paenibacillus dakarensis TaxID=1527293 RepID=UPI0006D533C1|nr:AraC family transcriptional regulator [Paenibacillus dakarensis]
MNDYREEAVEKAIQYMKEHLNEDIKAEQLANIVGYSPYHFARVFKSITGITIRQYLSALRIESGKSYLLKEPSLLVKILHSIGFSSSGSFHTRFKQFVGLSPKQFRSSSELLHNYVKQYESAPLSLPQGQESVLPRIQCHVTTPETFRGLIFVGLFPRPVPDQRPVAGTALNLRNRTCQFTGVPHGTYYVLAAGIPWSLNPRDYFLLEHAPRGIYDHSILVDETTDLNLKITLREPSPFDPPIVINLPLLLFEQDQKKNAK